MNHFFTTLATTLFFFSLFQTSTSTAQNHWETDFNGLKVKEEKIKSFNITESGEKGELTNTTSNFYYADGKRKKVVVNFYSEGKMAHSNTSTFVYRNDSLIHIINSYVQNLEEYGTDSGKTMDVTIAWHSPLLSAKSNTYNTINDYYTGESPASVSEFQYDENDRLYHQHIIVNNVYELIIKRHYDKKGELSKLNQIYNDLNSQESQETDIVFTITQSDKNGWTEMKNVIGDETTLNERELILYTEAELKDPANFYKPIPPAYNLKELIDKLNYAFYQDSLSEKDLRLMNMVIGLLIDNTELSKEETNGLLSKLYAKKAHHHFKNNEIEKSIHAAKEGLNLGEGKVTGTQKGFLNILAGIYESQEDYNTALSYYTPYVSLNPYGEYDDLGNYRVIKHAWLLSKTGDKKQALSVISPVLSEIDAKMESFTGPIKDERMYDTFSFFGKVESASNVLIEIGELKKAESYLSATVNFYEHAFDKESDEYKDRFKKLEKVREISD